MRQRLGVSVIVVVYDMPQQALNTIRSLAPDHQQSVSARDYEIVVVENRSARTLSEADVVVPPPTPVTCSGTKPVSPRAPRSTPAPAQPEVGPWRSWWTGTHGHPRVVAGILSARRMGRGTVVSVPGYHLGDRLHPEAAAQGWSAAQEQEMLQDLDWWAHGYRLFQRAVFSASCGDGYLVPMAESNCIALSRRMYRSLGGFDEGFQTLGGGYVNLDFYRRAVDAARRLVVLPGEGSFHQFHGGATTGAPASTGEALLAQMSAEYRRLRGTDHLAPGRAPILVGEIAPMPCRSWRTRWRGPRTVPAGCPGGAHMTDLPERTRPRLSVVVISYRMPHQALNTVRSFAPDYQRDVSAEDYEVILIENRSDRMTGREAVESIASNVRYFERDNVGASPVPSLVFGMEQARGDIVGLVIDGARMVTPRVISNALAAFRITPRGGRDSRVSPRIVRTAPQPRPRRGHRAGTAGPDRLADRRLPALRGLGLLPGPASVRVSAPAHGEQLRLLLPRRLRRDRRGGPALRHAWRGMVNLDLYKRLVERDDAQLFVTPARAPSTSTTVVSRPPRTRVATLCCTNPVSSTRRCVAATTRCRNGSRVSSERYRAGRCRRWSSVPPERCEPAGMSRINRVTGVAAARRRIAAARRQLPPRSELTPGSCAAGSADPPRPRLARDGPPLVSIVVIVYDMPRQAMNTLFSLSRRYQRDIDDVPYEVIVVENRSGNDLKRAAVERLGPEFRYLPRDEPGVSPVHAINEGIAAARADIIGVMIDGARMVTPVSSATPSTRFVPTRMRSSRPRFPPGFNDHQDSAAAGWDESGRTPPAGRDPVEAGRL